MKYQTFENKGNSSYFIERFLFLNKIIYQHNQGLNYTLKSFYKYTAKSTIHLKPDKVYIKNRNNFRNISRILK